MANASQGVGYFTGSAQGSNTTIEYVGGTRVRHGRVLEPHITASTTGTVMGSATVKLGRDDATARLIVGEPKDRAPNLPSGYSSKGVPTYGSGKLNTVLTYPADNSRGNTAKFSWNNPHPSGTHSKAYNTLT